MMNILCYRFSKYRVGTPGSQRSFPEIGEVKTIFITTLRCFLPFSLSFSQECTVEFSRGKIACRNTADWIQKHLRGSSCLLLNKTLKRFAHKRSKIMPPVTLSRFRKYFSLKYYLLTYNGLILSLNKLTSNLFKFPRLNF